MLFLVIYSCIYGFGFFHEKKMAMPIMYSMHNPQTSLNKRQHISLPAVYSARIATVRYL